MLQVPLELESLQAPWGPETPLKALAPRSAPRKTAAASAAASITAATTAIGAVRQMIPAVEKMEQARSVAALAEATDAAFETAGNGKVAEASAAAASDVTASAVAASAVGGSDVGASAAAVSSAKARTTCLEWHPRMDPS